MKLPKLPWWAWLLALYTAAGAALKFRLWQPRDGSALFWAPVFAPVLLLLRLFPDPQSPGANLPLKGLSLAPAGQSNFSQYRPRNNQDKYQTYLATTSLLKPLSYDQWLSEQLGETDNARELDPANYPGRGGGNVI